tara:strand:- start:1244 stop:2578 length:1335 start_codon:yes stop_codon:yes gene_type:complete
VANNDPFKDVECEHLVDSNVKQGKLPVYPKTCSIASELAGYHIPAHPANCQFCLACDKPKSDNEAIRGLINHRVHELGKYGSRGSGPKRATTKEESIGAGPGTELSKLLPKQLESRGCACKDYAKKMNRWGVEGCRQRFDSIVEYLVTKGKATPLLGWIPSVAARPVAKRLLTMAIERADKHTASDSSFEWFTAVTTAPRPECTLQQCIDSLIVAGFNPTIFAEPNSTKIKSCRTIVNPERMGVWYNWLNSCEHALNNTSANVIMTVQDDSLFHPDCKTFSEKILWPAEDCGFVSLYTPKHYSVVPHFKTKERDIGVNRVHTRSLWGACALIWPREVLEAVLEHEVTKTWLGAPTRSRSQSVMDKRRADRTLVQNSDTAIGKIMNRMKRSMYFVDPSPVEHISQYSVVGHGDNKGRRNCKRCAKWVMPLEDQVPINFEPVGVVL